MTLQLPHLAFMPPHAPWISRANQRWRKEHFLLLADCGCHRKRSTEFSKYFAKFPGSIGLKHRGMCSWTIPEALWTPKPWNLATSQVLPFHEILRSITKHIPRPNSVRMSAFRISQSSELKWGSFYFCRAWTVHFRSQCSCRATAMVTNLLQSTRAPKKKSPRATPSRGSLRIL